ncbi:LacI family DNA-binding transcriptional regulator [Neobacillus sp. FSL H8-0543]|uniref:LacI family DNA-binding transcriptional regulator n=1 Tax=Neobacillus sp. FSL H8-0543 TaxID=2954672 RepID=UPI0031582B62
MVTLKEIADIVGVSISTVSRVLNNDTSRSVGEQTRKKILEVAEELEYRPNAWAQKLVKGSREGSQTIGKIGCIISVPYAQFSYPYFTEILKGIESALSKRKSSLSFVHTIDELRDPEVLKKFITETKVDGIILVGSIIQDLYKIIKDNSRAVVGIDVNDVTIPTVSTDRQHASKAAVEHLLSKGHQKIGFIGGVGISGDITREKRFRGYRDAHLNAGIEINPNRIINAEWQIENCYKLMSRFIDEQKDDLPTAMFIASDVMAISAMRAAADKGLKIPEDLAFFGFDNIEISKYTAPPLSTIHIPKIEIGEMAANVLFDYMEERYVVPMRILLPYELCIRQST